MTTPKPVIEVAARVHYVNPRAVGNIDQCRAAIVTQVQPHAAVVGLQVIEPTGTFFDVAVPYHDGSETPGNPNCPVDHVAMPFRYCPCGWKEASYRAGSWHWPHPLAKETVMP